MLTGWHDNHTHIILPHMQHNIINYPPIVLES